MFAERYDMAIMSSKGMGTTALRTLVEELAGNTAILVLHDFDKSGFSIVGTLTRDTRRHKFETQPKVTDLGLRLADVREWKLVAEDVDNSADPSENLKLNNATKEEIEFLRGERTAYGEKRSWLGKRVELNAFTSADFVAWLEAKLKKYNIRKVIPDGATLDAACSRAIAIRNCQAVLRTALPQIEEGSKRLEAPKDLRKRIADQLDRNPSLSWDQAIDLIVPRNTSTTH